MDLVQFKTAFLKAFVKFNTPFDNNKVDVRQGDAPNIFEVFYEGESELCYDVRMLSLDEVLAHENRHLLMDDEIESFMFITNDVSEEILTLENAAFDICEAMEFNWNELDDEDGADVVDECEEEDEEEEY